MNRERLTFTFSIAYLWGLMILLGAILFETLVIYPDIFHDVPESLHTSMEFMAVRGPSDFFPPIGMLALLTGIGSVILSWRAENVRYWLLVSVILLAVGEFLLSVFFFWPRNTIMFEQGVAVHSVAVLQQTAWEFQTGHWIRLGTNVITSVMAFVGVLKIHKHRVVSQHCSPTDVETTNLNAQKRVRS